MCIRDRYVDLPFAPALGAVSVKATHADIVETIPIGIIFPDDYEKAIWCNGNPRRALLSARLGVDRPL